MAYRELRKGGKGSYSDFGWYISSWTDNPPEKKEITVEVPFRQGSIRFTDLNDGPYFSDRTATIVFDRETALNRNSPEIQRFLNWLMNDTAEYMVDSWDVVYGVTAKDGTGTKGKLLANWRYYGYVTGTEYEQDLSISKITATITAEPLKRRGYTSAADTMPWDSFLFPVDTLMPRDDVCAALCVNGKWVRGYFYNTGATNIELEGSASGGHVYGVRPTDQSADLSSMTYDEGVATAPGVRDYSTSTGGKLYYDKVMLKPGINYVWFYADADNCTLHLTMREMSV